MNDARLHILAHLKALAFTLLLSGTRAFTPRTLTVSVFASRALSLAARRPNPLPTFVSPASQRGFSTMPMLKRAAASEDAGEGKKGAKKAKVTPAKAAKEKAAPERASGREKKAGSLNEDAMVKATETAKPGSYVPPHDPKGMKGSAYLCKYPAAKGPQAKVLDKRGALPKRNEKGFLVFADFPAFSTNLTPSEVLQAGAFGGTYFRPISSAVTGESYTGVHKEHPAEWFKGIPEKNLVGTVYHASVNKWKVECGGALDMWESSGWISNLDPYGWFQWYCRFYEGRRSTDDERQIARMMGVAGPKGRFRNNLINKCYAAHAKHDDPEISPVIRQTLHHWAYCLTERDFTKYTKDK